MKSRLHVTIKFAQSVDGRIAAATGDSKWISNLESRKYAHKLRKENDAILVGINTVLKDDPILDVRLVKGKNPIRVILDTNLRLPMDSQIVETASKIKTIVVTSQFGKPVKMKKLEEKKIRIIKIAIKNKKVDIKKMLQKLNGMGVEKILVEGGSSIITSFIRENLVDKIVVIIAPKIIGEGINSVSDLKTTNINKAKKLRLDKVIKKKQDVILIYRA
ncbi:RibD family protein [bacterium]